MYFKKEKIVTEYETTNYDRYLYEGELFANQLCVSNENVSLNDFEVASSLHAAALFGVDQKKVFLSEHMHDRLFPASTTKILTLYLALKYGTLSDEVTVSKNAVSVPSDSSVAGLREGEQLTLEDLLYGLMLPSGNDSAVAIAEHISGSVDAFVQLMNQEANALGATNSHFVNPHGYHDKDHYTTAYDLYLIFNQGIQNEKFVDIISSPSYTTDIKEPDGSVRSVTWRQSNLFVNGTRTAPENVTVVGGKTGTTDEPEHVLFYMNRIVSRVRIFLLSWEPNRKMHFILQWIHYYLPYQGSHNESPIYIVKNLPYCQFCHKD